MVRVVVFGGSLPCRVSGIVSESQQTRRRQKMTTREDAYRSGPKYSVEEFVAKLQEYTAQNRRSDCALVVTDTGLDLCCTVETENGGLEVECTDVLDILKP